MFKNLFKKKKEQKLITVDYGNYVYKKRLERAITMIAGLSKTDFIKFLLEDQILFNNQKLNINSVDSYIIPKGTHTISIKSLNKIWIFNVI